MSGQPRRRVASNEENQVGARLLASSRLRVLLSLSRDLLQTDEASGSLELVGRTLVEMIRPDSALLLLRGDRLNLVGFDKHGAPRPAGTDHPLHQVGMPLLSGPEREDEQVRGDQQHEHGGPRTLACVLSFMVLTPSITTPYAFRSAKRGVAQGATRRNVPRSV